MGMSNSGPGSAGGNETGGLGVRQTQLPVPVVPCALDSEAHLIP